MRSSVSKYWSGGRFGVLDAWKLFTREQCDAWSSGLAAAFPCALTLFCFPIHLHVEPLAACQWCCLSIALSVPVSWGRECVEPNDWSQSEHLNHSIRSLMELLVTEQQKQ